MNRKIIAIIPARYQSSRFPGKPLSLIKGKPMIQWVYERVKIVPQLNNVYVATDDERIYSTVLGFGGNAIMTSSSHTCGTERLGECAEKLNLNAEDIIINVQGDEPLIRREMVEDLLEVFDDPNVYMGTLKKEISVPDELKNPNVVKVVTDVTGNALFFSRFPIPYNRQNSSAVKYFKHIGIYGYTKEFLSRFIQLPKTPAESMESLEQLRVLEHGFVIKVAETRWQTVGVDTPEQIKQVEYLLDKESH